MKRFLIILLSIFALLQSTAAQEVEITQKGFVDKQNTQNNYVVLDVPNSSKEILYNKALKFVGKYYNNPKFVTSTIENDQIVIDGATSDYIKIIYRLSGSNLWYYNYKIILDFKDNKVKVSPIFKFLSNSDDDDQINLIGKKILGTSTGLFNEKGKILKESGNQKINEVTNDLIQKLYLDLKQDSSNDW